MGAKNRCCRCRQAVSALIGMTANCISLNCKLYLSTFTHLFVQLVNYIFFEIEEEDKVKANKQMLQMQTVSSLIGITDCCK